MFAYLPALVIHIEFVHDQIDIEAVPLEDIVGRISCRIGDHAPATVADIAVIDAPGIASSLGPGAEAGDAAVVHADVFIEFALGADGVVRYGIGNPAEGAFQDLDEFRRVNGAAVDEIIDLDDLMDGPGRFAVE
jgi:hypothetical protein